VAGAPEPEVVIDPAEFTPALYNNPALTRKTVAVLKSVVGDAKVHAIAPMMGGEDFSRYGREGIPVFLFFLGTIAPEKVEAASKPGARPLPSLHSDYYYPVPEPSIRTGITCMSMAVLNLLGQ